MNYNAKRLYRIELWSGCCCVTLVTADSLVGSKRWWRNDLTLNTAGLLVMGMRVMEKFSGALYAVIAVVE